MDDYNYSPSGTVAEAAAADRVTFIRRTYVHLGIAIAAFAGLETYLLKASWATSLVGGMLQNWWIVLIAFMGVSWLANWWAQSSTSRGLQYLGLGAYVVIEAVIFLPLLSIAMYSLPEKTMVGGQLVSQGAILISSAGLMTALLVAGITATAFVTRKDFSFLSGILTVGGFAALGVMICSMIFGFQLGMLFSGAMILFAGGSILYTTSNIIHRYRTDQHVAAALALFAGVMLLFWYIVRLLLARRS